MIVALVRVIERLIQRVGYPLLLYSCVGRVSIAGKITVQVNASATRAHFGGVVGGRFWCADSAQILYVPYGVNVLGPLSDLAA